MPGVMQMAFLIAAPELLAAAATDLANIGSTISVANAAAAFPTTGVLAAGADEVSGEYRGVVRGARGRSIRRSARRRRSFHAQFVQLMNTGAGAYASAEAASASPLQSVQQDLLNVVNAPTQAAVGRPLHRQRRRRGAGQRV